MRFTVRDVERPVRRSKQAVRTGELALQGIGLRAVSAYASAEHRRDDAGIQVHATNRVAFGIGDVEIPPR